MWSAASTRGGCVCARPGDARGGFWRVSSTAHRPRPVDARAAASAASSKSAPPSWGAPGERRVDVVGDGSIRVSEACVSAECWASTRALDERVAHDRLSAAVESDVNFVDAGVAPPELRGDARFARWLRRRGGRREDLVVGGHLSRGAFVFENDEAERFVSAVDPKRAYRDVDDAIDRLLLSTGADWIDVLHVPWLAAAPESLRGRRRFERIVSRPLAKDASRTNLERVPVATEFSHEKGVREEAFTTAMDALRWVPLPLPLASVDSEKNQNQKRNALLVPTRVSRSSSSSSSAAEAQFAAIREAHRRALCDAVRRGKVRTLCVSFDTPWDACGLELGDAAFYEPSELAELWSASASGPDANARSSEKSFQTKKSLGDAVAGVSLSLSALRDPRLASRGDDYEATLERWCKPPAIFGGDRAGKLFEDSRSDSFFFERRGGRVPVVAARGVFFPDANSTEASRAEDLLASSMVRAASAFGDFTREDVALGLARARGYAACVAMGAVSSAAATSAMDDDTFAARLASFALRDADDDKNMHLDAACLAAVDAARLRHFKGASDAERGKGRGRGRGRDPFEELDEDSA